MTGNPSIPHSGTTVPGDSPGCRHEPSPAVDPRHWNASIVCWPPKRPRRQVERENREGFRAFVRSRRR